VKCVFEQRYLKWRCCAATFQANTAYPDPVSSWTTPPLALPELQPRMDCLN